MSALRFFFRTYFREKEANKSNLPYCHISSTCFFSSIKKKEVVIFSEFSELQRDSPKRTINLSLQSVTSTIKQFWHNCLLRKMSFYITAHYRLNDHDSVNRINGPKGNVV